MAEPPPLTAPAPAPETPPRLAGFEQLDARIKELTSSQGELLDRIQKLKLNWIIGEFLCLDGKMMENEQQKCFCRRCRTGAPTSRHRSRQARMSYRSWFWHMILGNEGNQSNEDTNQAPQPREPAQEFDTDAHMEKQTAMEA
uniref:Uncharacterized protein n=1 Tax=Oryza barthii TaxID=65489 RepID=A0A0D3GUT8_9ORYZ